LVLGQAVQRFTGRGDSVFMTRYLVPQNASAAPGVMQHYYGIAPGPVNEIGATRDALVSMGADVDFLLDVMPELQPLVKAGAQVVTKDTAGAFGPSSMFPQALGAYFKETSAPNRLPGWTLIVVGVETDYCVLATILGALDHYYRVLLVTDAVGSTQANSAQAQLDYTLRRFDHLVELGSTEEVLDMLS